jgi:hypothetical protein
MAETGRRADAATRARAERRPAAGAADRPAACAAMMASSPSKMTVSKAAPVPRTRPSAWTPRAGSNRRTGPTGQGQSRAAGDGDDPRKAHGQRGLRASGAKGAGNRDVTRRPAQQLREALADEDDHGERGDCTEDCQGDRLRPDRLLYLAADDVRPVDIERQRRQLPASAAPGLLLQPAGEVRQVVLQRVPASARDWDTLSAELLTCCVQGAGRCGPRLFLRRVMTLLAARWVCAERPA